MANNKPLVFIVDDDASVRKSLQRLIRSADIAVKAFSSAHEFLEYDEGCTDPRCMVLDVRMPGMSGLNLQEKLAESGRNLPIIFMTAYGDIPMTVRAMKKGAVHFLEKPFSDHDLLDAIHAALEKDKYAKQERDEISAIRERAARLTSREREVCALVVTGMLNKQIADELGIVEKTVKVHRARVMKKMQAESLADLVRMAYKIGI